MWCSGQDSNSRGIGEWAKTATAKWYSNGDTAPLYGYFSERERYTLSVFQAGDTGDSPTGIPVCGAAAAAAAGLGGSGRRQRSVVPRAEPAAAVCRASTVSVGCSVPGAPAVCRAGSSEIEPGGGAACRGERQDELTLPPGDLSGGAGRAGREGSPARGGPSSREKRGPTGSIGQQRFSGGIDGESATAPVRPVTG